MFFSVVIAYSTRFGGLRAGREADLDFLGDVFANKRSRPRYKARVGDDAAC